MRRRGYRLPFRLLMRSIVRRAPRTDLLTGLGTGSVLERDLRRLLRQRPLSLVVFDVDGLRPIGDRYGHAAGDAVLRELAEIVRDEAVKRAARGYRCDGDRFALLLPSASHQEAREAEEVAQAVRGRFAETIVSIDGCAEPIGGLTLAAGGTCSTVPRLWRATARRGVSSVLQQALIEVGKAKAAGGNCVRIRR